MNYTKIPRNLIYRERKNFEEFIQDNELTEIIIDNMQNIGVLMISDFEKRALTCLNMAYYICTMIMLEERPSWRWPEYRELAFCKEPYHKETYQAVTLSVVAILLKHYDEQWRQANGKFVSRIEEFVKSSKNVYMQIGLSGGKLVTENHDLIFNCLEAGIYEGFQIPQHVFAPRDLRDEDISEKGMSNSMEYVTSAIKNLQGRKLKLETVGVVMRRMKSYCRELNEILRAPGSISSYNLKMEETVRKLKDGVKILTNLEEEIRNSPNVVTLPSDKRPDERSTVRALLLEVSRLRQQLAEQACLAKENTGIAESPEVERPSEDDEPSIHKVNKADYTFTNNIRYELFLRLLECAGCKPGEQANQTTIGELWEALTEKKGEKCRQYIPRRKYKTTKTVKLIPNINSLLRNLGIDIEL